VVVHSRESAFAGLEGRRVTEELDGVRPEDLRNELREALGERYPKVLAAIDDALSATKSLSVSLTCKHCKRQGRYPAEIRDTRGALEAASFLIERGFGKPGVEQLGADQEKVIFVRVISGRDSERIYTAALNFIPEADRNAFHVAAAWSPETASV